MVIFREMCVACGALKSSVMQMSHVDVCVKAVQENHPNHLAQEGRKPLEATVTASFLHTVLLLSSQCQQEGQTLPIIQTFQ